MENFLLCEPTVFVVEDRYVISFFTRENGLATVLVDGTVFYEDNSGVLATNKNFFKIEIPQGLLDEKKKYTVRFRRLIARKSYYSELDEPASADFDFRPLEKTDGINIYHLADVHGRTDLAKSCASYFGDDLDLLILNGDITEVGSVGDYVSLFALSGEITHGRIPVLFSRGNHDTRGEQAERCNEFYPDNKNRNYYRFSVGILAGVILDCGEDKYDTQVEYGGVNAFEPYRREETRFLKKLEPTPDKITFAVSHICPMLPDREKNEIFSIENDVYTEWNAELERIKVQFMLCGHIHETHILKPFSEESNILHSYPVIFGSQPMGDNLWGQAIVLSRSGFTSVFTDINANERDKYRYDFIKTK